MDRWVYGRNRQGGRGPCRALTQPSSPSKGPSQHLVSSLARAHGQECRSLHLVTTGYYLPEPMGHPSMLEFHFSLSTPASAVNITVALSASLQIFKGQIQSSSLTQQIPLASKQAWARPFEGCNSLKTLQYHPDAFCTPLLQHQVPFHTAAITSWQQISTLDM